ncbi:MAG: uncharacterized protein QOG83_574 [Alphaproteobacteria bacterium]|nr:uncharacterized protein [Alphaproteobacteria bacterium]
MAADDLSAPLGQNRTRKRRLALPIAVPQVALGALALSVAVFAGWAMLVDDPFGGEPITVVAADLRADHTGKKPEDVSATTPAVPDRPNRYDGPPPVQPAVPATPAAPGSPPGTKTVTIIDGSSGKRQDVVIPNAQGGQADSPPENKPDPKAGARIPALDERLSEQSRHGLLPKVAQDGARPADVFARPVKTIVGKPNAPRVAIVVGGLGIGSTATGDALKKLPGPVTFAFAPYAGELERQIARARSDGHEVLLQVPMEPFDYPDNDPGPQTLLTTLDAGQNVDRLHWLMSRFQGYVGIANFMGARFTASEQALAPVLRETAKRGLLYLDDGSSSRSLASQIAGANNLAFTKADVVLDTVPAPADVDRALARLEALARDRGVAVGIASALPVSIDRIARWAKAAESRGVLVVPITAAVARPKSS